MNYLKKSLVAFVFFAFAGNISLATPTNTTPNTAQQEAKNVSLFRKVYSNVADSIKTSASFIGNNPKKFIALAATTISAVALYLYFQQIPASTPVLSYRDPICPNDSVLAKCINEAKDKFFGKLSKPAYKPQTQCNAQTPNEKCMYNETGYRGFRRYCGNDEIVLSPEETAYVLDHCSINGAVRSSVEEIQGTAMLTCKEAQNTVEYKPESCDAIANKLAEAHIPASTIKKMVEERDCYPTPAEEKNTSNQALMSSAANTTTNSLPQVQNPVCFANNTRTCAPRKTHFTPNVEQTIKKLTQLINDASDYDNDASDAQTPINK
jgi:hypothetical protein